MMDSSASAGAADFSPFDSLLLLSFGGPEKPDDVLPFLKNVTAGRGIPDERLIEVGEHYYSFGGRSPINDQNRQLIAALEADLERREVDVPLYWGNRNWEPYIDDTLRRIHADGHRNVGVITTSAYSSYSSCRQYREDLGMALEKLHAEGIDLTVDKIRQYYNHPGFVSASADNVEAALRAVGAGTGTKVLFVTHSIPQTMQEASEVGTPGYLRQHEDLMRTIISEVSERLGRIVEGELVFCSRSGPPTQQWLEPDINDRMAELKAEGISGVVAAPIGFVSDHMEVKFDLDTEARQTASELDLDYYRAATVGTSEAFVSGLVDLLAERAAELRGETPAVPVGGSLPACSPGSGACAVDCCIGKFDRPVAPVWPATASGIG
ncbi:ferrochelatase [Spelaeicoccus albus]|uniref:Coproporphyrin III ferrochelatase n=2 Tax=Spelaeicoccus albus TaxID=1280376 RepID=A0A7Z0D3E5_9MICO|nr:ferrochelatase [Spelaeicoccus albus]